MDDDNDEGPQRNRSVEATGPAMVIVINPLILPSIVSM
jgi:hypothetical protein